MPPFCNLTLHVERADPEFQLSNNVKLTPNFGLDNARAIIYGNLRHKNRVINDRAAKELATKEWHGHVLADYLSPSTTPSNRSRQNFLGSLGLANHEASNSDQVGPLDELTASHIYHGPFQLVLTQKPSDHLMCEETITGPIIKLLELDIIVNELVIPQLIGLTE